MAARRKFHFLTPSVLPGFWPAFGFTCLYLAVIILLPLAALFAKPWEMGWSKMIAAVTDARSLAAFRLTFGGAALAALINAFVGLLVAWALVRRRFPGRRIADAMVDLPFALPTAVAGIALTALYAPDGWIGSVLDRLGIQVAYTPLGVVIAMVFVGLPFVVRTVQPVLEDLDHGQEEAAASLGATKRQTFFRVLLPAVAPALITGATLAFARALGEYGSIIFIAGNLPYVSEIMPLLIVIKLEQYDYNGAAAIACAMLLASFLLLLAINGLQRWMRSREEGR